MNERPIPESMTVSAEVDAYPQTDPGRAFEIAEDFGLGSDFEQEHGYYWPAQIRKTCNGSGPASMRRYSP